MKREYQNLMEQIRVPEGLNERVLSAARRQRLEETGPKHQRNWRPVLRGAVCAVCALALVLGGISLRPVEETMEASGETELTYSFGLTAYAAETGETATPNANGGLAFGSGSGMTGEEIGHYTGCLFRVTGEGVETVSLAVDRGGLYRSESRKGLTTDEVRKLWQAEEAGGPVCTVYGDDEDGPMNAEVMTALGAGVTEDFDPEVSYGFWVPPENYAMEDDNGDMQQSAHDSMDLFDGARLTVTVTFADGGEQSKTYLLSTGPLRVEYHEDGSQILLPQLAGDDQSYVYGVYAIAEEEATWLQWPVQDSNTISLSNRYGYRWNPAGETRTFHAGIDIPAAQGAVVLAAADGTVIEAGFDADRGNYLVLDHGDGLTTVYAQCRNLEAEEGDTVKAGEMIAAVGSTGKSTGPHLCFQVWQDGEAQNPVAYFDSDIRDTLKMG